MRQPTGLVRQILAPLATEKIRGEIESMPSIHERIPTSAEVPFAQEAKRALNFAAEEADRLLHSYIGPEHLVLGLLREETSAAAVILAKHGLQLTDLRLQILGLIDETASASAATSARSTEQIDRIKSRVQELGRRVSPDTEDAHDLVALICDELDALRWHFDKG